MIAAGMAIASMYSAKKKNEAAMRAAANNAALQRARLEEAISRQAGDFATNKQRAREMAQRAEINIEKQKVMAESRVAETFAGSGISGVSVSELENEINAEVAEDKANIRRGLDTQLADMRQGNRQFMDDQVAQAGQIGAGGPNSTGFMDAVSAGTQGYAMGAEIDTALTKSGAYDKISNFFKSSPSKSMAIGAPIAISSASKRIG